MGNKLKKELVNLGYEEFCEDLYQKNIVDENGVRYIIEICLAPEIDKKFIECYFFNEGKVLMVVRLEEQDPRNAEMYLQYMWETLKLGYYELY